MRHRVLFGSNVIFSQQKITIPTIQRGTPQLSSDDSPTSSPHNEHPRLQLVLLKKKTWPWAGNAENYHGDVSNSENILELDRFKSTCKKKLSNKQNPNPNSMIEEDRGNFSKNILHIQSPSSPKQNHCIPFDGEPCKIIMMCTLFHNISCVTISSILHTCKSQKNPGSPCPNFLWTPDRVILFQRSFLPTSIEFPRSWSKQPITKVRITLAKGRVLRWLGWKGLKKNKLDGPINPIPQSTT